MNKPVQVLDKGYLLLKDTMGDDLRIVNAAKASFAKESEEFGNSEDRLLRFLIREGHWSPFRHAFVTLEVKAPLLIARQWWKYVVGSDHTMDSWNEASRRYITMETEFHVPEAWEWRSKPANMKQGSGAGLDTSAGNVLTETLIEYQRQGRDLYEWAIGEMNVAPEQARLFLPAYGMYTNWWWSCSLQSLCHFLHQRLADDAQYELQLYAKAVCKELRPHFPIVFDALIGVAEDD